MVRLGSTNTARAREMRRLLGEWERSGLPLGEFGRRRGMKASTLSWWRYVFRHAGKEGTRKKSAWRPSIARERSSEVPFVEVKLPAAEGVPTASVFEVVLQSGYVIRVPQSFDPVSLRVLVSALASPC